ncbi:MAG: cold shock domain-containing protein [Alphaproteobacteria bacterium]|nr:cold shock domain-containing protein [Alphaproteobacteria bacterium]
MPSGTVKFFNDAKGFGFVTLDEGGKDVFLPALSVTSSGLPGLKAGQRISFDVQPDSKGPKAVDLKLLAGQAPVQALKHQPGRAPETRSERPPTLYCDPASDMCAEIVAEFRAAGLEPRVVNYLETPPTRDELKSLSALVRDSGQSLVRQFDPLFQALNLDDRFISENEYWDGIVEHPVLINGPLVSTATRAAVCRSKDAVKAFLGVPSSKIAQSPPGRKSISPRLLQLMGGVVTALPVAEEAPVAQIEKPIVKPAPPKPDPVAVKTIKAPAAPAKTRAEKPAAKKSPAKKPAEKKLAEKKPKAKPAGTAKAKKVAKAPVRKPVKKAGRSARK